MRKFGRPCMYRSGAPCVCSSGRHEGPGVSAEPLMRRSRYRLTASSVRVVVVGVVMVVTRVVLGSLHRELHRRGVREAVAVGDLEGHDVLAGLLDRQREGRTAAGAGLVSAG